MSVCLGTKTAVFSRDFGPRGTKTAVFSRGFGPRGTKTAVFSMGFGPRGRETRLQEQCAHASIIFTFIQASRIDLRNVIFTYSK